MAGSAARVRYGEGVVKPSHPQSITTHVQRSPPARGILILGLTALISPIVVHSTVLRKELPILTVVTLLAIWQLWDGDLTRLDALGLLLVFGGS